MGFTHKGLLPSDDAAKIKCCLHCNTTTTPLWRGGPAGPKSLCNACGIRFRKRRISALGCDRKRDRLHNNSSTVSASSSCSGTTATRDGEEDLGECGSLRMRLMMAFGEEGVVVVQNLPSSVKKQRCQRRRKLGEEEEQEQAAVSLMALSCGSVFG